ncbi:nuclear transport factor 2 family protein [Saccharothrix deserti]|uniref:nuclear transport factor 2 family protein n=1 Tax=Saccharothrix deserti TaxID=2593674 RepID=UPI00131AA115|nr:nuclear transport factor 2 family protein [Saccharothrix deserti]
MSSPDEIVRAFVQGWNVPDPDPDQLSAYFAEDVVYHNIPLEPVVGRAAIRDAFAAFLKTFDATHWETHHQVASGNVVMNERTDTYHIGGRVGPVRVMGVFEVTDGLITGWRDYCDLAEAGRALDLQGGEDA